MARITASVGDGGANTRADVRTVQALLILNRGKLAPLKPGPMTGLADESTIAAIRVFQKSQALKTDGKIDPDGATLRALCKAEPPGDISITGTPLPDDARRVLAEILLAAGLRRAQVTSVARTPHDQARIMYGNIATNGVEANLRLYAEAGDKVVRVFESMAGKSRDEVIAAMEEKIIEVGPSNVSLHCSQSHYVFDIAPTSISDKIRFVEVIGLHKAVTRLFQPPVDPAYHLEIPKDSPVL